jgi:hypothetical protein
MDIKTLDQLRMTDERTQRFTPYGLGVDRMLTADSAADFQQHLIGEIELNPDVAEGTRQSFDLLCKVYPYGLFCYEIFTLVNDHALLVIEQALRDRFIDYHNGVVSFVDKDGAVDAVKAARYDDICAYLSKNRKRRPQLLVSAGPDAIDFNGMLSGLYRWARKVGLLRGQRNRRTEQALATLRNFVAHPSSYHLLDPVHAVRTMRELAEIINHLWGHSTPGGRLYPAPIRREVVALAWTADGRECVAADARHLTDEADAGDQWKYAIVKVAFAPFDERRSDPELLQFHSRYEVTRYPSEWLWGPGTRDEARAWFEANQPSGDECEYLDRIFAIRHDGDQLHLPMRPDIAAALPESEQAGTWYVVRADYPNDAYLHARNRINGRHCQAVGPCGDCHAELLDVGRYQSVIGLIEANRSDRAYTLEPVMGTPFAGPVSYAP